MTLGSTTSRLVRLVELTSAASSPAEKFYEVQQGGVVRLLSNCLSIYAQHGCSSKYFLIDERIAGLPWGFGSSLFHGRSLASGTSFDAAFDTAVGTMVQQATVGAPPTARARVAVNVRGTAPFADGPFTTYSGTFILANGKPFVEEARLQWATIDPATLRVGQQSAEVKLLAWGGHVSSSEGGFRSEVVPGSKPLAAPAGSLDYGLPPGLDFKYLDYNETPKAILAAAAQSQRFRELTSTADFIVERAILKPGNRADLSPAGTTAASSRAVNVRLNASGGGQGLLLEYAWTAQFFANKYVSNETRIGVERPVSAFPGLDQLERAKPMVRLGDFLKGINGSFRGQDFALEFFLTTNAAPPTEHGIRPRFAYALSFDPTSLEISEPTVGGQTEYFSSVASIDAFSGHLRLLLIPAKKLPCFDVGVSLKGFQTCPAEST